jgi:choline-glycine betaine transporter
MVIDGVMFLWFLLTALSVAFVAIDIRTTPEHPVMKWAFVLFTAYSGPFGAFLYVLGCREPLPAYMNNMPRRAGARRSARPCIASLAMASASSPAR